MASAADDLREALWVLGLHTLDPGTAAEAVPGEVVALAEERERARAVRDFARSDALRDEIGRHGYLVRDTPQGFELVRSDAPT